MARGPIDPSVLSLQHMHRSKDIVDSRKALDVLRLHCRSTRKFCAQSDRVRKLIDDCGFGPISRIQSFEFDPALITALVERWRQETHTFHLAIGEATITLQDVAILLGLPVDGQLVTGIDVLRADDVRRLCAEYLGHVPPPERIKSGRINLTWLLETFEHFPDDGDDEDVRRYTRAYILQLMGSVLFPDHSQAFVRASFLHILIDLTAVKTYSWGSAVLGYLYKALCHACRAGSRGIAGCCTLLQFWAWERLPMLSPLTRAPYQGGALGSRWPRNISFKHISTNTLVAYRDQLDRQEPGQMHWTPYDGVTKHLPEYCLDGSGIWQSRCPLICFELVEMHRPDRVYRQFGMVQPIPESCSIEEDLHNVTR